MESGGIVSSFVSKLWKSGPSAGPGTPLASTANILSQHKAATQAGFLEVGLGMGYVALCGVVVWACLGLLCAEPCPVVPTMCHLHAMFS